MKFSKFNLILRDEKYEQPVLFNTLSGSTFFVDDKIAAAVETRDLSVLDEMGREYLTRAGVIVDDCMNEDNIFTYNRDNIKYSSEVFSTTVFLTWACNLRCVYCFQERNGNVQHMDKDMADRYLKFVKDSTVNKGCKNVAVTLFGGEPLLNIEVGYYILETGTYHAKGCYGEKEKINRSLIMFIDKTIERQRRVDKELKE